MKSKSSGILAVLIVFACVAQAGAQVEPPYDPSILPQENAGQPTTIVVPEKIANSGAARLSYPIFLPPGRRAMAPHLALEYNSGGRNGMVGVGWNLSLPVIQRSTRNGLDYKGSSFEHDGEELAPRPDWGAGYYGAKREERFSKYQLSSPSAGWVVTTREGARYTFGAQTGSRLENPYGIFHWALDRVEDPNGNYYSITYFKDQGQIYPAQIVYTGNGRLNPTHSVEFAYESRPDAVLSYLTKARVVTAKRLTSITTKANGQVARYYDLVYEKGRSGRSRLKQLKADPLPPATFTYQEGATGAFSRTVHTTTTEGENQSGFVFQAHCDFDGYPDLIKFNSKGLTPYVYVYLSDGDGGYGAKISTKLAGGANTAGFILVADFDADGLADIVRADPLSTKGTVYFHRGLGNGAFASGIRSDLGGPSDSGRILVGDVLGQDGRLELIKLRSLTGLVTVHRLQANGVFDSGVSTNLGAVVDTGRLLVIDCNGDRRDDLVRINATSRVVAYLARADGTFASGIETDLANGFNDWGRILTGDFNGDGLTDLLKLESLSARAYVHFSLGSGAFGEGVKTDLGDLGGSAIHAGYILIADVDKDGSQDILRHYWNSTAVDCYRSNADGTFGRPVTTAPTAGDLFQGYVTAANIDGNGGADLIRRDRFGKIYTYASDPHVPDLLTQADNGTGATFAFSYRSSAAYDNLYLPFNLETLAAVSVDDGNGVVTTREFSYADGYYDPEDAEFRGFSLIEQTLPDHTTEETLFHQDDFLRGRERQVEHKDPADKVLSRTSLTWSADNQYGAARFVKLRTNRVEHFYSPSVVVQDDYGYSDTQGNVVSRLRSGTSAEAVTTTYGYRNCGFWNWRLDRETLAGSTSGLVRDTFFDYDSRGNKIVEERWNNEGGNPKTRWSYDAYGNPAAKTDAMGYTTAYEYETATYAYPAKVILPATGGVGHVWQAPAFDYRVGKAKTLEDENGNQTRYAYDSIGRLLQADFPDGGQRVYTYKDDTFPTYVKAAVQTGTGPPIVSYDYFDGLRRRIRTVSYGENGRPAYTKSFYDTLGRNYRQEGPCLTLTGGSPWEETTYDFWSRPVTVKRPDGAYGVVTTTHAHSGLTVTITDPDAASKTTIKDYLDRIVQVVEHSDRGDISTAFAYNAAGDLLTITNHAGVSTRFDCDSLGKIRGMSDPDMGSWGYTYDANGNLKTQTDGKLQTIVLDYDPLSRVTARRYSTPDPPVTYAYDNPSVANGAGRLHSVANTRVTVTADEYDEMGRPLSVSKTFSGNATAYTTRSDYDLAGNLVAMTYPVDDYRVNYGYHPGTRLLQRVRGMDGIEFAEFEDYSPDGKLGYIYQGNGTATTFSYDPKSTRLSAIRIQAPNVEPGSDIFHKTYRYSPAGDIKEITDQLKSVTRYYGYDKLHRLISETSSDAALVHPSRVVRLTYDYQGAGPFHAPKRIEARGRTHEIQYDANGNLVDGPALADPQNVHHRLISYTTDNMPSRIDQTGARCPESPAGSVCPEKVEFLYDGKNKRAVKSSAAGTTYYVGSHFEVVNGVPTRYIFAGDVRLAKVTSSGVLHFHKDHLTSTAAVSNAVGEKIESADYIPFGQERNHSGQRVTHYKYTDQELDPETGLYNYKARLYDPFVTNFLSPDPNLSANLSIAKNISPFGDRRAEKSLHSSEASKSEHFQNINNDRVSLIVDSSNNLNRYSYVKNNPLNFTDPNGLLAFRWHFLITFSAAVATERSFSESLVLAWQVMAVDFGSQGFNQEDTVKHAMANEGQSREQAISATKEFISTSLAKDNLAEAIHATQDLATPDHAGKPWTGFGINFETFKHIVGDVFPSRSTIIEACKNTETLLEKK